VCLEFIDSLLTISFWGWCYDQWLILQIAVDVYIRFWVLKERYGALNMGIVEKAAHHKVKGNKILLKFSFKQKNSKKYL
jgi:hypothetical protein